MARAHGRFSQLFVSVTSGGSASPLLYTASVTQNLNTAQADVTAFGDTSLVYVAGLPDGSLAISGFCSDTVASGLISAALDGVARKWYFYPFAITTAYSFGTGFFDWSVAAQVGDSVKMTTNMKPATGTGVSGF
jgi:hypothetical protein